jgi:hypothetical protein
MEVTSNDNVFALPSTLVYNQGYTKELTIQTPEQLSIPYWLIKHPEEGMYKVDQQKKRGTPADPPSITAAVKIEINGTSITLQAPVIYKTVDPAEGEVIRPLSIIPPVTVESNDEVLMFNQGHERIIQLKLTAAEDSVKGNLHLKTSCQTGKSLPTVIPWSFDACESITVQCTITPPTKSSRQI